MHIDSHWLSLTHIDAHWRTLTHIDAHWLNKLCFIFRFGLHVTKLQNLTFFLQTCSKPDFHCLSCFFVQITFSQTKNSLLLFENTIYMKISLLEAGFVYAVYALKFVENLHIISEKVVYFKIPDIWWISKVSASSTYNDHWYLPLHQWYFLDFNEKFKKW